jgi:drug/metabolite transporter (DMT)-like permease
MPIYLGIVFSFVALFGWGFGDFFIQKSARLVGNYKALFFIGLVGLVGFFPFVYSELATLTVRNIIFLTILSLVIALAAPVMFEALRRGKISVVEPILSLELPLTVILSIVIIGERLRLLQLLLIALVVIGMMLVMIVQRHTHWWSRIFFRKSIWEKGIWLAIWGALIAAAMNLLVGLASQQTSALMAIWFSHSFLAISYALYFWRRHELRSLWSALKKHPGPILGQSILDNIAWLAFALATTLIPISIATTISESYIVVAVILGFYLNKEKLRRHQILGVILAIVSVICLSIIS